MIEFNPRIFIISTIVTGILAVSSFMALYQLTQGYHNHLFFVAVLGRLFYIFAFPVLTLEWKLWTDGSSTALDVFAYFLDCILYASLIERVISVLIFWFKRNKSL